MPIYVLVCTLYACYYLSFASLFTICIHIYRQNLTKDIKITPSPLLISLLQSPQDAHSASLGSRSQSRSQYPGGSSSGSRGSGSGGEWLHIHEDGGRYAVYEAVPIDTASTTTSVSCTLYICFFSFSIYVFSHIHTSIICILKPNIHCTTYTITTPLTLLLYYSYYSLSLQASTACYHLQ